MPLNDDFDSAFFDLVRTSSDPEPVFAKLGERIHEIIGTRLFTTTVFDMQARKSRRVYSENPQAYPVGGFKPVSDGLWENTVLVRHQIFHAPSIEKVAEVFFDWELIQSLGNESCANIPAIVGGEVIGTLNLLHEAGYYTAERFARAGELEPYATIAFLMALRGRA